MLLSADNADVCKMTTFCVNKPYVCTKVMQAYAESLSQSDQLCRAGCG